MLLSPVSRKRGKVAVSTTGSRTITSPEARPTLSLLQATAMTRTVPAKAGISNATSAWPERTSTMPEYNASGACDGGLPLSSAPASPPVLICPRVPCMPSMSWP